MPHQNEGQKERNFVVKSSIAIARQHAGINPIKNDGFDNIQKIENTARSA